MGNSGDWLTTTVNLPAAAAGQNVQFRWVSATDGGNYYGGVGWYVDTVSLQDGYYTCCSDTADLALSQVASPSALLAGQNLTFIVTITNAGSGLASGVSVTDVLPAGVSFVSGTPGSSYAAGSVAWPLGPLPSGTSSNVTVTVTPIATRPFTNTVRVDSATPDPNPNDDTATLMVDTNALVVIATQPGSQVVTAGAMAGFQVTADGPAPLSYQWFFNGTNALVGATAATLTLTNVQPDQAGGFSVVVSSTDGSVTSAVATLRVLVPPTLDVAGLRVTGAQVSISLRSVSGLNYTLEFTTSLTDRSWTPLPPAVPGTGDTITLADTNAVPAEGNRFYRILCN